MNKEIIIKGIMWVLIGFWFKKKKLVLIYFWDIWEILNMGWMLYDILELLLIFLGILLMVWLWENVFIFKIWILKYLGVKYDVICNLFLMI